ncbi:unnamed protein product [Aphanomyces euteiches]
MPPSRVLLDENDVHLILSNPLVENTRATLRVPQKKLGKIEAKQEEKKRHEEDRWSRRRDAENEADFGQDTALVRNADKKPRIDTRIRDKLGHIHHSLPAVKLNLTQPELPLAKLREFHRPRGKFKIHEHMRVFSAKEAEKTKSVKLNEAELNDPTLSQIKKSSDLNPNTIEPQIEVPAPNSRSANDFIRPYMSFHILRLFKRTSDGERLKIEDIARTFPKQSSTAVRRRMKEVATFERGGDDPGWWKKKAPSELISEDEIRAKVSPESVCLYESMMSGHQRLLDMGLTKQFTPNGVQDAISHLMKRLKNREQTMSSKILGPKGLTGRALAIEEKKLWDQDPVIINLRNDIQIARSINEQLLLTPWNLTNGYVECHLQGKGSGMLLLGGIGDPSARGEGFSFVRAPHSRVKQDESEGSVAHQPQNTVSSLMGTSADLRKLTMKEAGEVLRNLGISDSAIKKLRRWDRIYMIRQLSNQMSAYGLAGGLRKFVRGARKSLNAQQQEYRQKCDVVYNRQLEVLSSTKTNFEDDSESGSEEDDGFAEDLEDGLLVEEATTSRNNRDLKGIFKQGSVNWIRSKETLNERDDLAELRRLKDDLRDGAPAPSSRINRPDLDANSLRSNLKASGIKNSLSESSIASTRRNSVASSALPSPVKTASNIQALRASQHRQAIKRTTRIIGEDGTESVKIEFIIDPKRVDLFVSAQKFKEQQQNDKESNQLQKRKKLEDAEHDGNPQQMFYDSERRKRPRTS